jgi:hypothetical protein
MLSKCQTHKPFVLNTSLTSALTVMAKGANRDASDEVYESTRAEEMLDAEKGYSFSILNRSRSAPLSLLAPSFAGPPPSFSGLATPS